MKKFCVLFFTMALFSSASVFAQDVRATTDDGRTVMLKKNGTWFFVNRAQPQDASATMYNGRVVTLKKDGTWTLTNTTKPVSSIPRPVYSTSDQSNSTATNNNLSALLTSNDGNPTNFKGKQVPSFTYKNLDGSEVNINSLKGKVVLINFWAGWCEPCRKEMPYLEKEIWQKLQRHNFVMIAFTKDHSNDQLKGFAKETGYTFPVAFDQDGKISKLFAVESIPRNYVIGKDGKVIYQHVGFGEENFYKMRDIIVKALMN